MRMALKTVESARQAVVRGSAADRAAHVGYHLIDQGRRDLEADVAYRPRFAKRMRRLVFAHTTLVYLGPIAILTAILLAASAAYLRHEGASARVVAFRSDFADAESQDMPEDAAILSAVRAGVDDLNRRFGPEHTDRFFLCHRDRRWNAREHAWMGWERKRGKIEEFNRLLRGATDTGFTVQVGALAVFPSVRYCITLDSDTRLPRNAARRLIGVLEHPLNRPRLDAREGRVVEGYGILQPRVSVTMASAAGSLFARAYAGHTGIDPYSTTVSDTYQDLFGEGNFTGKGLYDVDAFTAALEGRVAENAMLSHDLFEGLFARCALVSDVEVVDD